MSVIDVIARFDEGPPHIDKYNTIMNQIGLMDLRDLDDLLRKGECPYPVRHLIGVAFGMHHCPICGTMVVAGVSHQRMDPPWDPEKSAFCQAFYETHPELRHR